MKSYKDIEIYAISMKLFLEVHPFTMELPRLEMYELGSQLRRSADSIHTNIVEGYGRRRFKGDFIKFLVYAHASSLETINHLEKIGSLYPSFQGIVIRLEMEYKILSAQIYRFIQFVERDWKTEKL